MNCKQGDLALVIAGWDAGKTVTCLEALPAGWVRDDLPRGYRQPILAELGPLWRVDRLIEWDASDESHIRKRGVSTAIHVIPDSALMPIRPEPDEDELPAKVPVRAEAA